MLSHLDLIIVLIALLVSGSVAQLKKSQSSKYVGKFSAHFVTFNGALKTSACVIGKFT